MNEMKEETEKKKYPAGLRVVFFGTPEFAVASLDRLVGAGVDVAAVVTAPDKPVGRGRRIAQSAVKEYAAARGLTVLQPEKLRDESFLEELHGLGADLFIVIAFRMLPESVWAMPPEGTFNLHASLLPRYRGAAPINWAVINGESETGVTTFFLKHEIDTGDIIESESVAIGPDECVGDVHDRLMELGAEMTLRTVRRIEEGNVTVSPQPEGEFVPAPKIFKEDCRLDWTEESGKIHNKVRGLSPYPTAWTTFTDSRDPGESHDLKIFKTRLTDRQAPEGSEPGDALCGKNALFAVTADGVIEILELQPAGKKRMDSGAFLRGYSPVKFS